MIYSENIESKVMDKVFKSGESKICGRQPLKNLKGYGLLTRDMVCLGRPYPFKFFKGCRPQILFAPLLHILSYLGSLSDIYD